MHISMTTFKQASSVRKQRGLALFVALIALVAMSLAAAALVRSVDSGVLVAGNLAFKQSAKLAADNGIAQAYKYINENAAALDANSGAGYYASFDAEKTADEELAALKSNAIWNTAFDMSSIADVDDLTKNRVKYIVERMCKSEGAPDATKCMMGTGSTRGNSNKDPSYGRLGGGKGASGTPVYRVTVRVADVKNTYTYLQAFVY